MQLEHNDKQLKVKSYIDGLLSSAIAYSIEDDIKLLNEENSQICLTLDLMQSPNNRGEKLTLVEDAVAALKAVKLKNEFSIENLSAQLDMAKSPV